jgi:hypothetical protein
LAATSPEIAGVAGIALSGAAKISYGTGERRL